MPRINKIKNTHFMYVSLQNFKIIMGVVGFFFFFFWGVVYKKIT